jgi:hypothetical protein
MKNKKTKRISAIFILNAILLSVFAGTSLVGLVGSANTPAGSGIIIPADPNGV